MPRTPEWLTRIVGTNLALKALAFGLALITFHAVRSTTSYEASFEVPLAVEVEKGFAVMSQDPLTVEVTCRGSQEDLAGLKQEKVKVVVNARTDSPDEPERTLPVGTGDVRSAPRVRVIRVRPETVRLRFDREDSKVVAVSRPRVVGTPFRGKVELTYEPTNVTVYGSHRGLKEIASVDTQPVDVDGRAQSFSRVVGVLPPANTWVSSIAPPEVTVKVSISTRTIDRVWTNVPVLAILRSGRIRNVVFDPPAVTVTLRGREEVLSGLVLPPAAVLADCSAVDPSTSNRVAVAANLPPSIDVQATLSPDSVAVGPAPDP
jgi:YbbR domain-containing protein